MSSVKGYLPVLPDLNKFINHLQTKSEIVVYQNLVALAFLQVRLVSDRTN